MFSDTTFSIEVGNLQWKIKMKYIILGNIKM